MEKVISAENMETFNPEKVLELARDKSEQGRAMLAEEVGQIFESKLTESERNLANGIMLTLLRQAELDLREALSERLAVLDGVPEDLIFQLTHDEISVASSVLMHSTVLKDPDLIEIIHSKGEEYWQCIAQRQEISERVVKTLIETRDSKTALCLVENEGVRFDIQSMKTLGQIALKDDELHEPLLRRPEVNNEVAMTLYLCVSQGLRREILSKYNVNALDLDKALQDIIQEMSDVVLGSFEVSEEMMGLAGHFYERDEISADLLIKTLRRGQVAFFGALFSTWLDVSPNFVRILIEKEGGKHLAAACRAVGVMKSEFASIFLLSRGLRDGDKVVDQTELSFALKNFDRINPNAAKRVLSDWSEAVEFQ